MPISRRKLLKKSSVVFVVSGLAGCRGSGGSGGDTPTPTQTPKPTSTPTPTQTPTPTETPTPTKKPEPAFELTEIRTRRSIAASGQKITAAATIKNTGSGAGSTSVEVSLDVQDASVKTDTIEPGDATQVTATVKIPLVDPGRYPLKAKLANGQSMSIPIDIFEDLSSPGLYGSLLSPTEQSVAGSNLRIISSEPGKKFVNTGVNIGSKERFTVPHLRDNLDYTISITFRKGRSNYGKANGIPAIVGLKENIRIGNKATVLGQYSVPRGYQTQVQLLDSTGSPIPNFDPITVRSGIGVGTPQFTTNSEGYLIAKGASNPGITLPPQDQSNIRLDARVGNQRPDVFGTIFGSQKGEEFTIEITNPDQYRS